MGCHELMIYPMSQFLLCFILSRSPTNFFFSLGTEISHILSLPDLHHSSPQQQYPVLAWYTCFKQWSCTETSLTPEVQNSHWASPLVKSAVYLGLLPSTMVPSIVFVKCIMICIHVCGSIQIGFTHYSENPYFVYSSLHL